MKTPKTLHPVNLNQRNQFYNFEYNRVCMAGILKVVDILRDEFVNDRGLHFPVTGSKEQVSSYVYSVYYAMHN